MRYVRRQLEAHLLKAARSFPAVVLTGPRRAGKTWLLKHLLPNADYHLLEDPSVVARLRSDPETFLDGLRFPVILDEVQNVPEVFALVRARLDARPARAGKWFLTGSQEAPLMKGVTESMAGRAAVVQLMPFSSKEHTKVGVLRGGYPEVIARPGAAAMWFSSYVQTYLERDVRAVTAVRDLATFRRFLALVATRHGQVLNKTDLAAPLGVSVPTITEWLSVLETTAQILIVPPFYENFGKRLIKSPKLYVADPGLACHLLGIETTAELSKSPFAGSLFEGFIASEIVKSQVNKVRRRELYYFRDEQGLEVDFVIPAGNGNVRLIECKATRTVVPKMTGPLQRLRESMRKRGHQQKLVEAYLVHQPGKTPTTTQAIAAGVRALTWPEFVAVL